jgi:hypothetical protein
MCHGWLFTHIRRPAESSALLAPNGCLSVARLSLCGRRLASSQPGAGSGHPWLPLKGLYGSGRDTGANADSVNHWGKARRVISGP